MIVWPIPKSLWILLAQEKVGVTKRLYICFIRNLVATSYQFWANGVRKGFDDEGKAKAL
jgi:hypothetical protein